MPKDIHIPASTEQAITPSHMHETEEGGDDLAISLLNSYDF